MTVALAPRILALAVVYFAAARLGLAFAFVAEQVTPVWPPTGIALAALLLFGTRLWPGIALGAFAANLLANEPATTAAGIAAGNTLEALAATWLLRRAGVRPALDRLRDVGALLVMGALGTPIVSATIGVASLCAGGVHPWSAFAGLWWLWWIGDAMGDVLVAPLLLVWLGSRPRWPSSPERTLEAGALMAVLGGVTLAAFSRELGWGVSGYPLHYTVFPLVVYAALRFGQRGATVASFTASAIAIWGTTHGQGPLAVGTATERLVMLLLFLAVVAVTGLLLAAAIHERNAAEQRRAAGFERLEESEQRLRLALEAGRMGVWDWDLVTGQVRWSQHLEESFGLPPGGFAGTYAAFRELVHPDDVMRVEAVIAAAIERGGYDDQLRVVRPDGAVRWMAASGTVLRDAAGRAVRMLGVGVDVTDRRLLEEELTRRAGALSDADRRKDVFLAMLAHELRSPLAPIANALHLVRVAPAERDRALGIAERQVGLLARLVDDLLDVSRITQGKIELSRERAALADVIGDAVETARPQIEAGGQVFTTELPPEPVWLDGDPLRLAQVIGNLLGNAAKYTPRGGSIHLAAGRDGAWVTIRVRDTGVGVPAELLPRIFDLFVQGDAGLERRQGGLGVGLTIVQQLVALHGGRVEARAAPGGRGSEFVVGLPAAAEAHVPQHPARAAGALNGAAREILLVEDNEDAAESLARVLELWGHTVRIASDGPGALAELAGVAPDVILSDLGLPGMDGYELARRIRETPRGRDTVMIALSGYGQDEDRRRAFDAGFDHHLVKPPDLGVLAELLAASVAASR